MGILTGGGDCPGLNAAIRAATKTAIHKFGLEVYGIRDGFLGALEGRFQKLEYDHVSGILTRGGTILGSNNRVDPFQFGPDKQDLSERCLDNLQQQKIEALLVLGGDGTLTIAHKFLQKGLLLVAVPKTIDNDVHQTEWTIGFHSAAAVAGQAIDALHSTAESHHRVMVVEVMGRHTGWIALYAGVASGGDVILIPEIPCDTEKICGIIKERDKRGRTFSIVVVAEGTRNQGEMVIKREVAESPEKIRLGGVGRVIADKIEDQTGKEARVVILGHLQRSGVPVDFDRLLATQFGEKGVKLLTEGRFGQMTAYRCGEVVSVDLSAVARGPKLVPLDHPLLETARCIGTSFGA